MKQLADYIRSIPNFPKPGIIFRDITTLIEDPKGFRIAIDAIKDAVESWGQIDKIATPEARGFIFGSTLAYQLNAGLTLIRKPGKLPYSTVSEEYELEYGIDKIEMHVDSIQKGDRVLLIDDLLATGGTIAACRKLIEKKGGIVIGAAFVIELIDLKGREKFKDLPVFAPIVFEGK